MAVAAAGLIFAILANQLSPRGLPLKAGVGLSQAPLTNASTAPPLSATPTPSTETSSTATNEQATAPTVPGAASSEPIMELEDTAVVALHEDPRREAELILFVDARGQQAFEEGHIPGAWPYDPYRPGRFLGELLPLCMTAELVVLYCNGGRCEDSHLAARQLLEAGVPADRLRIYTGGITAWREAGRPLETGPHGSGILLPGAHSQP